MYTPKLFGRKILLNTTVNIEKCHIAEMFLFLILYFANLYSIVFLILLYLVNGQTVYEQFIMNTDL